MTTEGWNMPFFLRFVRWLGVSRHELVAVVSQSPADKDMGTEAEKSQLLAATT
jgi:hypothetical protein